MVRALAWAASVGRLLGLLGLRLLGSLLLLMLSKHSCVLVRARRSGHVRRGRETCVLCLLSSVDARRGVHGVLPGQDAADVAHGLVAGLFVGELGVLALEVLFELEDLLL